MGRHVTMHTTTCDLKSPRTLHIVTPSHHAHYNMRHQVIIHNATCDLKSPHKLQHATLMPIIAAYSQQQGRD